MFSKIYEARYGDYKNFDEIKPSTILDFVQDISVKDSESVGYGFRVLKDMNLAWLMQGINMRIEKPCRTIVPFEVSTGVISLKGATSERACIIKQEGETVAKTVANWFLYNSEKNRISKILPEMQSAYRFEKFDDNFFSYVKPSLDNSAKVLYSVRVSNKDIDTNIHLNNQKSAEMLMDALPFEFKFNDAKILYKRPAFLGNILDVCMKETENGYYVHLQTKENEICVAGTFEKEC